MIFWFYYKLDFNNEIAPTLTEFPKAQTSKMYVFLYFSIF
jgi:hypothetical protein